MSTLNWWTLEPQDWRCCGAGDSLHLRCGPSGAGGRISSFSTYGSRSSVRVSFPIGYNFNADVNLFLADGGGLLVVADVTCKSFEFRVVAVYAPNSTAERVCLFRLLTPFLDDLKRIVLVVDWNGIFDPKNRIGRETGESGMYENSMPHFRARYSLVDKFRLDHSRKEMCTWLDSSPSFRATSYLERVLEELTLIFSSVYIPVCRPTIGVLG